MVDTMQNQWFLWHRWDLVVLSIAVHLFVLAIFIGSTFISPKKSILSSNSVLISFIIALYFEMYGIPLTIYLLQPVLTKSFIYIIYPIPLPIRILGSLLILAGFVLIYLGWRKIFAKQDRLVTTGIYSHIRNPQYLGLMLLTFGQLVQWPTLLGTILWPLVVLIYLRLSHREEQYLKKSYGEEFVNYKKETPAFFPRIKLRSLGVKEETS